MKRVVTIALLAALGCATGVGMFPIEYDFVDNIPERRVEITFTNDFGFSVCLLPETWPNPKGVIDQGAEFMALVVDGQRFPVIDVNTGYCLGRDCETVVAPGETVSSFVRYDDFGLPEELESSTKHLDFTTGTYRCSPKP